MSTVVGEYKPFELLFACQPGPRPFTQQFLEVIQVVVVDLSADLIKALQMARKPESGAGLVGGNLVCRRKMLHRPYEISNRTTVPRFASRTALTASVVNSVNVNHRVVVRCCGCRRCRRP